MNEGTHLTDNVPLITGPSSGYSLAIGRDSIQGRNNGSASTLTLNYAGGNVSIGSSGSSSNVQGKLIINTTTTTADDLPAILQMSIKDTTTGKTYTDSVIVAHQDHGSTPYGFNLRVGCGGNTVVGAGESSANLYTAILKGNTGENLYLTADGASYLYSNANTVANRVGIKMDTAGNILPQKAEAINNNAQNLGASDNKWKNIYAGTFNGYTIEKSVPSNAVFTDTNTKVNVTLATTTKAYLLGVSTAPTATAAALTAVSDTGVYLDTTAGKLTATSFAGNGAALTALNGSNISTGTVAFARLPTMYAGSVAIASSSSNTKVHNSGYLNLYANNGSAATRYIDIVGKNNAGTSVCEIFYDIGHATNISSGFWYFRCKSPQSTADTTSTGYHDQYYLPGVTAGLTANRSYMIFTGSIGTSALTAGTSSLKSNCFYAMYT